MLDSKVFICVNDGDYVAARINGKVYQLNAFDYLSKNCNNLIKVYSYLNDSNDDDLYFSGSWLLNNFTEYFIKNLLLVNGNVISDYDFKTHYDF